MTSIHIKGHVFGGYAILQLFSHWWSHPQENTLFIAISIHDSLKKFLLIYDWNTKKGKKSKGFKSGDRPVQATEPIYLLLLSHVSSEISEAPSFMIHISSTCLIIGMSFSNPGSSLGRKFSIWSSDLIGYGPIRLLS